MTVSSKSLFDQAKQARAELRAAGHKFDRLLSAPNSNPKLEKSNAQLKVLTAPLHLAPAKLSGFEVCPKATDGCRAACLHTAGNPAFMLSKHKSRIDKTKAYFTHRAAFMAVLAYDIAKLREKAHKENRQAGIRLNATSDIPWEKVSFELNGAKVSNLPTLFSDVQFYDYTKRANRRDLPANYHLTFSLAEDNDRDAVKALESGISVAAVFTTPRTKPLPGVMYATRDGNSYHLTAIEPMFWERAFTVIDGDEHDYRPIDPLGVIVGLRAKGDARKDKSGFVRPVS